MVTEFEKKATVDMYVQTTTRCLSEWYYHHIALDLVQCQTEYVVVTVAVYRQTNQSPLQVWAQSYLPQ